MKVYWDKQAETRRDQIADYIFERFGYRRMEEYIEDVEQSVKMICRYPNIGSIDPLFADRSKEYRSVIVNGLSKMVYNVTDDTINIVAFWDCRQEPATQTQGEPKA